MTAFLPPNLLALFAARDPIPYQPPVDKLSVEKKRNNYGCVAHFLKDFEDPKDTPPPTRVETKDERKERKRKERAEQIAYKLEQDLALWDPHSAGVNTDPYKTLFVARINYDSSESKLRREFEVYGPIRKIKVGTDKFTGKPRGYAFIEYEHERDMHSAYKHADGKKIDGRRVLVDVERGRTVKGWRPRRLGGGLGGTRKGGPDENTRFSGRDESFRERGGEGGRAGAERSPSKDREREPRERRRRTRSRERPERVERDRGERRRRSRSRDNKKREEEEERPDRRKRVKRSRSRDRERKRSRSRDKERKKRRSRSRDRKKREDGQEQPPDGQFGDGEIKEERLDAGYDTAYNRSFPNNGSNEDQEEPDEQEQEEGQYSEFMLQNM